MHFLIQLINLFIIIFTWTLWYYFLFGVCCVLICHVKAISLDLENVSGQCWSTECNKIFLLFVCLFPLTTSVELLLIPPPTEHQDWQDYSSSCTSSLHKIQLYNRVEAGNCHRLLWRKQHVFRAVEWHWTNYVVTKAILFTYYFAFVAVIFLLSMSFIFYINIGGYLKICCIFY